MNTDKPIATALILKYGSLMKAYRHWSHCPFDVLHNMTQEEVQFVNEYYSDYLRSVQTECTAFETDRWNIPYAD